MKTHYIRFCKVHVDAVWGAEPTPWVRTPLIRVTRNVLRKAAFEWVGAPKARLDLAEIRRMYPAVIREEVQR